MCQVVLRPLKLIYLLVIVLILALTYPSIKCNYPIKNSNAWLFEDFETHRHILHYSNLLVATNIHLIKYHGRPLNKDLWKVHESDHEEILETLRVRADPKGSLN